VQSEESQSCAARYVLWAAQFLFILLCGVALDVENYYFEESEIPYSKPRSKDTVIERMLVDIKRCDSFVLSAVTGDYGDQIIN
jgi:hypothetical protein